MLKNTSPIIQKKSNVSKFHNPVMYIKLKVSLLSGQECSTYKIKGYTGNDLNPGFVPFVTTIGRCNLDIW